MTNREVYTEILNKLDVLTETEFAIVEIAMEHWVQWMDEDNDPIIHKVVEGREVMQELVKKFDIPMHLEGGRTFLQDVTLRLTPSDLPMLECNYVIARLKI